MLIDLLQDLHDALYTGDLEKAEEIYSKLNELGMSMETAVETVKAGKKYFSRNDKEDSNDSVSETDDEDL